MRVLIFSTAYVPFIGGAELAIKEITDRLPDISFTLITARLKRALPRHERLGNVLVYRVGHGCPCDKWFLPFRAFWLAKKLERQVKFDAIWSMMASHASIAAAWFKKAFPAKKLVLTLQEGDEEEHLRRYVFGNDFLYRLLIRPWHLAVFKRADAITAISNYLAERARENNSRVPITVVPNGVDTERFKISARGGSFSDGKDLRFKKEEIRKKLGINLDDKVVITTSRLVEKNGIGDLITAMLFLPENVKLLICGSGQLERSYKLKAKSYKLNNRVHFLGYISHEHLPDYLHIADVFCRPSRSEGMGSSFIEAMAAGLPVIATPVGGIPDFLNSPSPLSPPQADPSSGGQGGLEWGWNAKVEDLFSNSHELENRWSGKMTGLFCKVGDPKDIAEKVMLFLSSDELRTRIIVNASKMVTEKYDWKGIAEKMREILTPGVF